ncbi:MAG: diaminopimelate epimerase [Actinobacteria bacterium]|jgi:diaminopimelate epimerase|nr:MAG: diaminopimelate epimerase [Actinomycetota bacterium]
MSSRRLAFTKGHGTGNDFVLLPDPRAELTVTPEAVRAVCDRRFGIGGDGLIRVVPDGDLWFMDYHNADGSIGEMCGNGARVFAMFLQREGLVAADEFVIATRGGHRQVVVADHISVDMGFPEVAAGDVVVQVGDQQWPAEAVFMPNPHAVVFVDDLELSLTNAPVVTSTVFPEGQNVEFVSVVAPGRHVRMRVHERGVGETLSCGTGICAVADRVLAAAGIEGSADVQVEVPGGSLTVTRSPAGSLVLTGPAALVADGTLSEPLSEMFL